MTPPPAIHRQHCPERSWSEPSRSGVALVLVLAFLVLLSALILAFFSRALSDRVVSNGSANQTKVELFARGALDSVVGDLKQEMAAGAPSPAPSPVSSGPTLYLPKPTTAVPNRVGTANSLPNLVKTSAYNTTNGTAYPFYSGSDYNTTAYPASSRASAVSSTTASANGRSVTAARWNSHCLLPKKNTASDTDLTPIGDFTAPNWITVSRNGTNPTAWNASLADATPSNGSFVTGRYAYAVYDEGGLLDMNVAGHPSGTTTAQTAYKPAVALADLTQIGLTQTQVDQIVGWRNYASAAPTGSFPAFTFSAGQATNFYNFVTGNWRAHGFMSVANTALNGNQSDRAFPDRQALMRLLIQGIGGTGADSASVAIRANLQSSLQYMGTFSRDLDSPSYCPSSAMPPVQNSTATNTAPYGRGNDAYGTDRYNSTTPTIRSPYDINPPFPAVRVTTPFVRPDGTTANVGDPLMKYRFPLSRLAEILRTDMTSTSKDPNNPVYRDFGIYRPTGKGPWLYDHGDPGGILRLSYPSGGTIHSGVAQMGREPDFFELLKAAIAVGSVGKSINGATSRQYWVDQLALDDLSAQQILQIGANIIDQSDTDGYPTQIVFANYANVPSKVVSGIEDLPYIVNVRDRPSFVSVANGRWFEQPILWNLHDSSGGGTPANAPATFQISAHAVDPSSTSSFYITYNSSKLPDGNTHTAASRSVTCEWDKTSSAFTPLQFSAGEGNHNYGFRLPTLIGEKGMPASANATGNELTQVVDPTLTLVGVVAADYPSLLKVTSDDGKSTCYAGKINFSGPSDGVQFDLAYMDGTTPVAYDSFICWFKGDAVKMYNTGVNTDTLALANLNSSFVNTASQKVMDAQKWYGVTRTDPRTRRWDPATAQYSYQYAPVSVSDNTCDTFRAAAGTSYGTHDDTWDDAGLVGGYNNENTPTPGYRGFQWGFWQENSIRNTVEDDASANPELRRFIHDPDGIVRRAMGGYASDPSQGGSTNATAVTGLPLATRSSTNTPVPQSDSRPLMLNRPFKSVAELGYTFRETPWSNINFSFPESGDSALLDVFRVDEPSLTSNGVVAGQVNLNTRQAPVLQALFAGTNIETTSTGTDLASIIDATAAQQLAAALIARTTNASPTSAPLAPKVPIASKAEIVGTWANPSTSLSSTDPNPDDYFSGFSSDIGTIAEWQGQKQALITRKREAAIRALADTGSARTWNLLIDVVAQTGRFAPGAASMDKFSVDGEKRYWLHVAIDRATGTVIDRQLETVDQ